MSLSCSEATQAPDSPPPVRTSEILRGILSKNPGVKAFSVRRILASIGEDRLEAKLMLFSLPALVPIPRPRGIVAMPTGAIACQLVSGQKQARLPAFILKKCVSRKALAVAIHAVLPMLEAAEKVLRPRWTWVSHAISRRVIGLFVFLLALAIAYPLFGFNALHATSIFVMALGMAEQDGLAVMVGVAAGLLSLAILAASGMSASALRARASKWLRKIGRKLGLRSLAHVLRRLGYVRLARLVAFEWSTLLLMWDPEQPASAQVVRRPAPRTVVAARKRKRQLPAERVAASAVAFHATPLAVTTL